MEKLLGWNGEERMQILVLQKILIVDDRGRTAFLCSRMELSLISVALCEKKRRPLTSPQRNVVFHLLGTKYPNQFPLPSYRRCSLSSQ